MYDVISLGTSKAECVALAPHAPPWRSSSPTCSALAFLAFVCCLYFHVFLHLLLTKRCTAAPACASWAHTSAQVQPARGLGLGRWSRHGVSCGLRETDCNRQVHLDCAPLTWVSDGEACTNRKRRIHCSSLSRRSCTTPAPRTPNNLVQQTSCSH